MKSNPETQSPSSQWRTNDSKWSTEEYTLLYAATQGIIKVKKSIKNHRKPQHRSRVHKMLIATGQKLWEEL